MSSSRYIVVAVVRCSFGLRAVTGAPVELAEAEVAVGDEGAHAELVGSREGLAVVLLGGLHVWGVGLARRSRRGGGGPRPRCRAPSAGARGRGRAGQPQSRRPGGRPGGAPPRGGRGGAGGWRCRSRRGWRTLPLAGRRPRRGGRTARTRSRARRRDVEEGRRRSYPAHLDGRARAAGWPARSRRGGAARAPTPVGDDEAGRVVDLAGDPVGFLALAIASANSPSSARHQASRPCANTDTRVPVSNRTTADRPETPPRPAEAFVARSILADRLPDDAEALGRPCLEGESPWLVARRGSAGLARSARSGSPAMKVASRAGPGPAPVGARRPAPRRGPRPGGHAACTRYSCLVPACAPCWRRGAGRWPAPFARDPPGDAGGRRASGRSRPRPLDRRSGPSPSGQLDGDSGRPSPTPRPGPRGGPGARRAPRAARDTGPRWPRPPGRGGPAGGPGGGSRRPLRGSGRA